MLTQNSNNMPSRRKFIQTSALASAGMAFSAKSYARIIGANDRVQVGIAGFSDRFRSSLLPAFMQHAAELNFELIGVSDIWNRRREEGVANLQSRFSKTIKPFRNNEELFEKGKPDAVIISTADFQHALHCVEAVRAGCDVYVEKPLAESLDDAKLVLKTVEASDKVGQIGSQRRSGSNYWAAYDFIKSGKFGKITAVEMTWNVNQPGRWRRPELVASIKESDTDWKRFLLNRPYEAWDPRKYLEYRLFFPYSSGIPGQWMSHQIDTVHWFSGYDHPRSVVANGGIYMWNDGRVNADTITAVFEYGPENAGPGESFQVIYSSRMHNAAGDVKEIYFSNGGTLNLDTNEITPEGGLTENHAKSMGMKPFLLERGTLANAQRVETGANTGVDNLTSAHMRNWMECVRNRKTPNAGVRAGYNHSVANIMTHTALTAGKRVTFDKLKQEVVVS